MKSIKYTYTYKTEYRNENGQLHRLNGPAVEFHNEYTAYYVDGELHRIDGPAVEWTDGRKKYWIDGIYLYQKYKLILILLNKLLQ